MASGILMSSSVVSSRSAWADSMRTTRMSLISGQNVQPEARNPLGLARAGSAVASAAASARCLGAPGRVATLTGGVDRLGEHISLCSPSAEQVWSVAGRASTSCAASAGGLRASCPRQKSDRTQLHPRLPTLKAIWTRGVALSSAGATCIINIPPFRPSLCLLDCAILCSDRSFASSSGRNQN